MPSAIAEFQQLLTGLANEAASGIERLLGRLDRLDLGEARAFLTDAYPELITPFLAAAADLTATWYEEQPGPVGFQAVTPAPAPVEQLGTSARWALTQSGPVITLSGSATKAIFNSSRETVLANVEVDRGARYARYASANACSFCRVLATKGAVYRSKASATRVVGRSVNLTTSDYRSIAAGQISYNDALARRAENSVYQTERGAKKAGKKVGDRLASVGAVRGTRELGEKYHDHCYCLAVMVRDGDTYEPPPYVEQWERDYVDAVKNAKAQGKTKGEYGAIDLKAVVNAMDRRRRSDRPAVKAKDAPAAEPATAGGGGGDDGGRIPPNRPVVGGMDMPDEYPELPDGSKVPFTPADRPVPTAEDRERVLDKHRHGADEPGKTMFPADWSDDDIMNAIDITTADPAANLHRAGDKLILERMVDGELVRVQIRLDLDPPQFWSAYPPNGTMPS